MENKTYLIETDLKEFPVVELPTLDDPEFGQKMRTALSENFNQIDMINGKWAEIMSSLGEVIAIKNQLLEDRQEIETRAKAISLEYIEATGEKIKGISKRPKISYIFKDDLVPAYLTIGDQEIELFKSKPTLDTTKAKKYAEFLPKGSVETKTSFSIAFNKAYLKD